MDLWLRMHMTFAEDLSSQPPVALAPRDPLVPVGTPTLTPIPTPTYLHAQTHSFNIFFKRALLEAAISGTTGAGLGDTSWLWAGQGTQRPSNCVWVSCREPARKPWVPSGCWNPQSVDPVYTVSSSICVLMINFDPRRHLMASLHPICIVGIYLPLQPGEVIPCPGRTK